TILTSKTARNGYISDAVGCIEFARQHAARVLNLSWGNSEFSAALSNALAAARADGIAVVAAAGNNAANLDLLPYYPASLVMDNIVAVGASTRTDEPWILSNYGNATVHLFAPGAAICSTSQSNDTAYQTRDGTSMAAACVAGTLALMRQRWPDAPVDALRARLLLSADAKSTLTGRCVSGGRLNLRKAIDQPAVAMAWSNQLTQITAFGVPGHSYVVAASTNLNGWAPLCVCRAEPNGCWFFTDFESTNFPARFYRAEPGP
ncbi:MAG: S8 family serine peptidase, partial [Verrucomicrobiota bacterium]|nr:S8 family serine peptidase [Verrucomicrobiota bacterium]